MNGLPPGVVALSLAAPHRCYVSTWSALYRHGLIEQIPRVTHAVTLGGGRAVFTEDGWFTFHHIEPELFGGYTGDAQRGFLAEPEKALFDSVYLRARDRLPSHHLPSFPELYLPTGRFDPARFEPWLARIADPGLRGVVTAALERAIAHAEWEDV